MNPDLLAWFTSTGWQPFPFQSEVWAAYLNGESGLVHAPTGTGKTYAAWLGPLAEWMNTNPPPYPDIVERRDTPPLTVLWLTPMRALAVDTEKALQAVLDALHLPWSLETRTGDTSSTVRGRQRKRLPTALITTPESLSLLLTYQDARQQFKHLKAVIVDEWHELMSSKRGVQTELGLARLRRWNPDLRIWGLSATMGNLEEALQALLGSHDFETGEVPKGRIIQGEMPKAIEIESVIPATMERFPWAGHLGLRLLPQVIDIIEQGQSTLLFTNTRSQTERWYQELLDARPDWAGLIAIHHSSLEQAARRWVEAALRNGQLKCVVSTSSLDLGVDFSPVDQVIQVGSPKGIARLIQRAGRSGHQPGATSKIHFVPTHALEFIEISAVRVAMDAGIIESRPPIEKPLDVLAQHLVTVGLGGGFEPEDLYREVRTAYAYRHLTQMEFDWTVQFVVSGGAALHAYDQYHKLVKQDGRYVVESRQVARVHRMSIGTITSNPMLTVKFQKGKKIGQIDEAFVSRLRQGDHFTLAGRVLEFRRMQDMNVVVRLAKTQKGVIPRWVGGKLPYSEALVGCVRYVLDEAAKGNLLTPEMAAIERLLALQVRRSMIPTRDTLLVEQAKTRFGHHLFVYPFEGWAVHEGMMALIAYRLTRHQPITFTMVANDYGFELLSPEAAPLSTALADGLFSPYNLTEDILNSLNAAELARRQFREIAQIAGLLFARFPGGHKTSRQLQASSGLLYDVLTNYDEDNLLLEQARREVLDQQLEQSRLRRVLADLTTKQICVKQVPYPTPLAFPLMDRRMRQTISSETLEDRIQRMIASFDDAD